MQDPLEDACTVALIIVTSAERENDDWDRGMSELKLPSDVVAGEVRRAGAVIRI